MVNQSFLNYNLNVYAMDPLYQYCPIDPFYGALVSL